jgi:hypothetical protein
MTCPDQPRVVGSDDQDVHVGKAEIFYCFVFLKILNLCL